MVHPFLLQIQLFLLALRLVECLLDKLNEILDLLIHLLGFGSSNTQLGSCIIQ